MDLGLDGTIAVGERQASNDGILVLAQAVCKTRQLSDVARFDGREPRLKLLTTTQAQHSHELLCQRIGLARRLAALANQFQFGLFLGSQLLGITDEQPGRGIGREVIGSCWWRKDDLLWIVAKRLEKACYDAYGSTKADVARISSYSCFTS